MSIDFSKLNENRQKTLAALLKDISNTNSGLTYFPFSSIKYVYKNRIGNITDEHWYKILLSNNEHLVETNFFDKSQIRADKLKIWDAVIGIPNPSSKFDKIHRPFNLCTTKFINDYWSKILTKDLGRVGYLSNTGEFLRPTNKFIFDLMQYPYGWKLLEGSHALAHKLIDIDKALKAGEKFSMGITHSYHCNILANMVICLMFNLPFNVDNLKNIMYGNIDQYGIYIKTTTNYRSPVLLVPVNNDASLIPDHHIVVLGTSVYIEPHPYSFNIGSDEWKDINRWSCQPTQVMFYGWELVDIVTHSNFCYSNNFTKKSDQLSYGLAPEDLNGPDTFELFLNIARKYRGDPIVDNKQYWFVEDWLCSNDYNRTVLSAPPLPCPNCTRINIMAEGAPRKPAGLPPDAEKKKFFNINGETINSWKKWEQKFNEILSIVENAIVSYECSIYGVKEAKNRRKMQQTNYKRKFIKLKELKKLKKRINKAKKDGKISEMQALKKQMENMFSEAVNMS